MDGLQPVSVMVAVVLAGMVALAGMDAMAVAVAVLLDLAPLKRAVREVLERSSLILRPARR